jgi:hypothetical protein
MTRLTDSDKNWGPFTLARWNNRFSIMLSSGDEETGQAINTLTLNGFGWALRIKLPKLIHPWRIRHEAHWDKETVRRLGRNHYFETHDREFGFALSDMGNGYDFLQVHFGAQTHDSDTDMNWCKHLPWKQWACVRSSIYRPDGTHFATEKKGKFFEFLRVKKTCPASCFGFEDYDGEMIVATCIVEEREWHRGEGSFKWLRWFYPKKIRRSLDLHFSSEVGPEKGSWKGGTIGHGIEMLKGENPRQAFERYCAKEHDRKGSKFKLRFIGPCQPTTHEARSSP